MELPYRGSCPYFVSYLSLGQTEEGARGMSVERLELIVAGILVLLVLILLVSSAMACGLPCN